MQDIKLDLLPDVFVRQDIKLDQFWDLCDIQNARLDHSKNYY